ncbi:MAG: bifunctional methionine sulfoxide reductase B/A protein [Planctomycetota bacterium]
MIQMVFASLIGIALGAGGALVSLNGAGPSIQGDVMPTSHATDLPVYSDSGHDITPLPRETVEKLAEKLSDEARKIMLNDGTEPPFCGGLLDNKQEGTYCCALCSLPLFSSDAKFDSGSGWPSFFQPVDVAHIHTKEDRSYGMVRTEIECERCRGHLGHVFQDGPKPTGLRFCLNGQAMVFFANGEALPPAAQPVQTETAYFAGGCFWGIEDRFEHTPGVLDAVSGYQGGHVDTPTYREVCNGTTGHTESVRVVYDPARVSYRDLLELFFRIHNPTTLNRQGPDVGTQYRSAIFAANESQAKQAKAFIDELEDRGQWGDKKIVTELNPMATFWPAEEYHQDYNVRHGRSCGLPQ